jgi:hypothetical protein
MSPWKGIIPTTRSMLYGALIAIVMGREESKIFMWLATALEEENIVD